MLFILFQSIFYIQESKILYKEARQELNKMDQYSRKIELLAKNKIEDINQLNSCQQQRQDELNEELIQVDKKLNQRNKALIEEYKLSRNITEELIEQDQMKWVQEMNDIKRCVDEIIWNEMVRK